MPRLLIAKYFLYNAALSKHTNRFNMALSKEKIKEFKRIGHTLKPVVMVSENGVSEGVLQELNRALDDHELIKVKISCGDRELKKQLTTELCERANSELLQTIGNIALIYRAASKPNAKLSNISRYYHS